MLRRAALLVLTALVLACASGAPSVPAPIPPPATAAPAGDPTLERRALLLALADRREFEPTGLAPLLAAEPEARQDLAVALGRIGDARGRPMLQGLLVDSEVEVRRAAAFALGELDDKAGVPALLRAAVDDDTETGALAVEALGKLGAPLADVRRVLGALDPAPARDRLLPFLFRFKEPAAVDVARAALACAAPCPYSDRAALARVTELESPRSAAVYALSREPRPESADLLRSALADPEAAIRGWAARGLAAAGALEDLPDLLARVDDTDPGVRVQALRAGAAIVGRAKALPPTSWGTAILGRFDDPLPGVRAAAIEASGSFLPNPELAVRLSARAHEGGERERELVLHALSQGHADAAAAALTAAALEASDVLRAAAAEGAAQIGDQALVDRLARDPSPRVRVAALGAALALAGDDPALAEGVAMPALADPDPTVRSTAIDALGAKAQLPVERLKAVWAAARTDDLDDARLSAIRAVQARVQRAPGERSDAVDFLTRVAEGGDYLARRAAIHALGELGEPLPANGPIDTGHDLEWYADVIRQTSRPRQVDLATERGTLRIQIACPEAPLTCLSFLKLAGQGYFDGLRFHRVVPDFVVQGGDPRGDGWGGPGYLLRDEINRQRYRRGAVGMALSGPDTGGSQFFFTLSPQPHLDGGYTVFGAVVRGAAILEQIEQGDRILSIREVSGGGA
ncbi:MAG: peptidylprolyl isomerase [Thermoanaerobaculia bacterium]